MSNPNPRRSVNDVENDEQTDKPKSLSFLRPEHDIAEIKQNPQNLPFGQDIDEYLLGTDQGKELNDTLEDIQAAFTRFNQAFANFNCPVTGEMAKQSKIIQNAKNANTMQGLGYLNVFPFNKTTLSQPRPRPARPRRARLAPSRLARPRPARLAQPPAPIHVNRRRTWTKEEEQKVIEFVQQHGSDNFYPLSLTLKRPTKKIRERWQNYISPNINIKEWTLEEDDILIKLVNALGTKWTLISKSFDNKSDIDCKNRWESTLKHGVNNPNKYTCNIQ